MHTISLEIQPTLEMYIDNQCANFKLTNRRIFATFMDWDVFTKKEVDASNMTGGCLSSPFAVFEGGLMYQLQRKDIESGNQSESTSILFFITWVSEGHREFRVRVQLMECDKTFSWHKIDVREYYKRYVDQLYNSPKEDAWLIHGSTVLLTGFVLDFTQEYGVLNITISEGAYDKGIKRPVWLDPKR
jgi:hypothetical protein